MTEIVSRRLFASLLLLFLPLAANAGITSVTRTGASTNCAPEIVEPFQDGSIAYCDQGYTWTGFPPEAAGELLDYVKVADADAGRSDYGLEITVDRAGSLLLLIDPAIDVANDMPWVIDGGFVREDGINWTLDQGGASVVHDLWVVDVQDPANPIVLGPQNDGLHGNYGVAFATDAGDLEISIKDDPDPYILNSGLGWSRTWRVENLGSSAIDDIVVRIGATGITDSTFVDLQTSPNSSFNEQGQFRWRIPTLEDGEAATLTVVRRLGPGQQIGTGVIETTGEIEAFTGFDPNLLNNTASESTSVLELPPAITSVTRLGGSANCAPSLAGTLYEGAPAYCDETFFVSLLPPEADGEPIEYILTANADRSVPDYGLSIEVSRPGSLLLFIDPTIDVPSEMAWVVDDGFALVEGITVTLNRDGPEAVFAIWSRDIDDTSGPITTGPQNLDGGSNYVVAYNGDIGDLALDIDAMPNPYRAGSGESLVRTYTLQNLGPGPMDEVVVALSSTGFNDVSLVSLQTSPNSTFNQLGAFRWRVQTLDAGATATLTIAVTLGADQEPGADVITVQATVESVDGFDADSANDNAVLGITVLGDVIVSDGFEPSEPAAGGE